ncbi:MAG: hypothetical protein HFH62_14680 [Lachnospiraceae bacterium]|nr:hypothetical protein [Lachnospiraceae bacterium]
MKRICVILSIVVLCICCASMGVQVVAIEGNELYEENNDSDLLSNNSFYRTHKKECKRSGHGYLAKKEVTCYKNPESDIKVAPIEKGACFYIICTYQTNFDTWGLASNGIDKWVKLRDLKFEENVDSFIAEYWKEIGKSKDAKLRKTLGTMADTLQKGIVKWSYPCSGKIVGTCSKNKYPTIDFILGHSSFIFEDTQGRYWMIYGAGRFYLEETGNNKSYAICLSDPENDQIGKEITLTEPYTGGKYGRWLVAVPIGIVICILIATFIILRVRSKLRIKKMAEDI